MNINILILKKYTIFYRKKLNSSEKIDKKVRRRILIIYRAIYSRNFSLPFAVNKLQINKCLLSKGNLLNQKKRGKNFSFMLTTVKNYLLVEKSYIHFITLLAKEEKGKNLFSYEFLSCFYFYFYFLSFTRSQRIFSFHINCKLITKVRCTWQDSFQMNEHPKNWLLTFIFENFFCTRRVILQNN